MADWLLVDSTNPSDSTEGGSAITIHSQAQLLAELSQLSQRGPGIVGLEGMGGLTLEIGIGGPLAGIRQFRSQRTWRVVLTDRPSVSEPIDFAFEEDVLTFWPDELLPVDTALAVIAHFHERQHLPAWIGWKEWNVESKTWVVTHGIERKPWASAST